MTRKEREWKVGLEGVGPGNLGGAFSSGQGELQRSWRVGPAGGQRWALASRQLMKEVERRLGTWQDFPGRILPG